MEVEVVSATLCAVGTRLPVCSVMSSSIQSVVRCAVASAYGAFMCADPVCATARTHAGTRQRGMVRSFCDALGLGPLAGNTHRANLHGTPGARSPDGWFGQW